MNIYTYSDLEELIVNKTIDSDISIFDDEIKTLGDIEIVNGDLGLISCELESLGNLKKIKGSFVISTTRSVSFIESLENIEEIGGDCWLRYTNIKSLGQLKRVNGNLNLRDTNIQELGNLAYVGGNLFLPLESKDKLDLNSITVIGKIRFKEKEKKIDHNTTKLNIVEAPKWKTNQFTDYCNLNDSQKSFFDRYKKEFFAGNYWNINNYDNYSKLLFQDLCEIKDDLIRNEYLVHLKREYPNVSYYVDEFLVNYYDSNQQFEESWNVIKINNFIQFETIIEYEFKTGKRLLNGELIKCFVTLDYLTNYGIQNLEEIKLIFNELIHVIENEQNESFFNKFINPNGNQINLSNYLSNLFDFFVTNGRFNLDNMDYYKKYFLRESDFHFYRKIDTSIYIQTGTYYQLPHIIEKSIKSQIKIILRDCENKLRERRNMPLIGEGWISETDLFYKIKEEFFDYKVVHSAKPKWLGRQHLDIHIEELNIGIEYQGKQHFEPVDFFGGEESFIRNVERDLRKKQLCEENGCLLIYVLEDYNINEIFETIKQHERNK